MAGLFLAAVAVAAPPPLPREPTDRISVEPHDDMLALSWSDAEERLKGSILPAVPREGQALQVNLQVSSFEGAPFEGPLIVTLREEGATHGQSITVKRDAQHWQATFTPEREGPHLLDVSFRTTRHKALHAALHVRPSRLPWMLGWAILGLGCAVALGYTVRGLLRGEQREERPLPADPPAAPSAGTPAPDTAQSPLPGADAPSGGEPPAAVVDAGAQPPDAAPMTSEGKPPSSG